jgi:hypothetical protein
MSMFDQLLAQAGNVDVNGLAARVGLNPDQLRQGAEAMLGRMMHHGEAPEQAAGSAAQETGLPVGNLQALVPMLTQLAGNIDLRSLVSNPGGIIAALDKDGDGNPLDDLGNMAKGLFGR